MDTFELSVASTGESPNAMCIVWTLCSKLRKARHIAKMTLNTPSIFLLLISGIFCQYDYGPAEDYGYDPFGPSSAVCAPECNCPLSYPTAMYCDNLKLKTIPIVPSGIKYLYLRNNMIEGIEENTFDNVTDLQWLILDHNHLENSKIKGRVFSKLKHLKKLHINYNNLTEVVGPLPKTLDDLQLSHNKITKVNPSALEGLVNLTVIHLQNNQLKADAISGAFKGLNSLLYLDLSFNRLTKLPSGLPHSLLMLYFDNNQISNVPDEYFQGFKALQYLRLSHNKLTDSGIPGNVFNITSLVELDLSFNQLKSIPTVSENLENFYLQVNKINKFPLSSFCKVVGPTTYSKITHLRLDGNNLTRADLPQEMYNCLRVAAEVSLEQKMTLNICTSLLLLFFINSVWTRTVRQVYDELDPEHWSHYTSECPRECFCPPSFPNALYCDNKGLKEIPAIPARIWYLYLQNNLIETISEKPFVNATHLRWINLNKNKITNSGIESGALSKLKRLLYLFLEDNELEEVPAPLPVGLEQLRLARNKISRIPEGVFSNLENLTMLDLHQNSLLDSALQSDTFQGLNNLMQLNIAKNSLKKMPLSIPANTLQLFLDNNSIEVIPENYFSAIPKVTFLRLNYNKLSDDGIPPNGFNVSSILDLQLSHNQLTKIPPINAHLEHLHLDHNRIKSVNGTQICPVSIAVEEDYGFYGNIPRLRYLRLDGNEIQPPIPLDIMICFRLLQAVVI
ncbi:keratocan [Limosa lapponica baueri]|uniref:Keratocan n=1 Tax=Limosa lapponica baueri TaxID=1758121 RepID=A0A2I0UL35_LIMLA|nr:keratocan [Limosa lapponica baueri]